MWVETKYFLVKENKLSELGLENIEDDELLSDFAFDTREVESFRKSIDEDENVIEDEVFVHFKSGFAILLAINYNTLLNLVLKGEKEDVS